MRAHHDYQGRRREMKKRYSIFKALVIIYSLSVCLGLGAPAVLSSSPSYWPTEGWRASTPEEQGMDSRMLAEALDFLQKGKEDFNLHSITIIRNGYLVMDAYFYPFTQGSLHDLASVTKSFTSTLIGIAIDEGYIESVDEPVLGFFPERTIANVDANKEGMTLEDLLTMRSGFECINKPTEVTLFQMMGSPDWIQFTLDLPMVEVPGTRYVYCSPNPHLLSGIIREVSGMSALEFAEEHLFLPLGISGVDWTYGPGGNNMGWGDIRMTPQDMAKLGYLYLHEGSWDGQQVLPPTWVAAATDPAASLPEGIPMVDYYGYMWWLNSSESYYLADGRGGQRIFVLPDQDMIVITTGGGGRDQYGVLGTLLTSYIIPAAKSEASLPPNPDGVTLLESKTREVAESLAERRSPPPLPEIAQGISGKRYVLDANPFGLASLSLTFEEEEDEALLGIAFMDGSQVEWPVGLDNIFRMSPGRHGLPSAMKGSWESENTFLIYLDEIGNINQFRIKSTFEDDGVIIDMQEMTGLGGATFGGRVQES